MKKALSVILAAAMALSLAGCGGSGASGSGSSGGSTAAAGKETTAAFTVAAVTNAAATTAAAGETKVQETTKAEKIIDTSKKKELVVSTPNETKYTIAFDPDGAPSNYDAPVLSQIFETLFKMEPDGSISPMLATGYEWSDDGREMTVHLRDDVDFSNGDHMTAEDAAFCIDQFASQVRGKTYFPGYLGVDVIGDYDLVIKLDTPYPALIYSLVHRITYILDKKYFEEVGLEGYKENLIGTGPYIRTEVVLGDHQTLVKRDNYWDKENDPYYEKITVKFLTDGNAQMLALENGEVDILVQASIGPFLKLPADSNIGFDVCSASSIMGMSMNMLWGPTSDKRFRQALQYAVNRDELNLGVYEGYAQPADMYGCPLFMSCPDAGTYTSVPEHDPEKAKELLKEMGYNGEEFILLVQSGTKADLAAQIVQGELLNIGVNCTVKSLDSASMGALNRTAEGWNCLIRSMNNSLVDMSCLVVPYSYDYRAVGGKSAPISERNEWYEEGLKAATAITDPEERKTAFAELVSWMNEEVVYIPLLQEFNVTGYNKEVEGVHAYPFNGIIYYTDLY